MATQDYKFLTTHAHEVLICTILYRLIHAKAPNIGVINSDINSDLATLKLNQGEQLEDSPTRIFRLE